MEKQWYQKQLRILQTVLREKDLQNYDAERVIQYMLETDTNCLVVNAGGVRDFFTNRLPLGKPACYLNGQDILTQLVRHCRKHHLRIIVRVDFRGVEQDRYELAPDWFGRDEEGGPLTGWNDRIFRPCYLSRYGSDHAEEFLHQLLEHYDVDGVWENCVVFGYGPCYCRKCREQYYMDTGKTIPEGSDYRSSIFSDYRKWKALYAGEHMDRMRRVVKSFGEDKAYVSEIFGMHHVSSSITSGIDLYDAIERFDFLVTPGFLDGSSQPDRKYETYLNASSCMHFLKAIAPEKQAVMLTGGNGTKWRYVKAPVLESRIWMWEAVSAGGTLWNTYFNGQHPDAAPDRRNAGMEKDVYAYLKANQDILMGQIPGGDVGIYYSRPTRDRFGSDDEKQDEYGTFIKGAERVLTEYHIPYRFIPDLDFKKEKLIGLKVLLLPNAACMSEAEIEILREFVREGGGLVASYQTSLYDENGQQRTDFGLADLFGCSYTGIIRDTQYDCYQKIRVRHPVLNSMGSEYTSFLMNEGKTLLCRKMKEEYAAVCTYVPMIYNQPPELAWIENEDTEYPTIQAGSYGAGRIVYFANQTDRSCITNGHEDIVQSYYNAITWVAQSPFSLRTNAPEGVHIGWTVHAEPGEYAVISLVNTVSGPFRPIRSLQPVPDLEIVLPGDLEQYRILYQEGEVWVSDREAGRNKETVIHIALLKEFTAVALKLR